jgi:hypothetical protein
VTDWIRRNEAYVGEIGGDDQLTDTAYVEVLEDLIDRAQSAVDAKHTEMDSGDETAETED